MNLTAQQLSQSTPATLLAIAVLAILVAFLKPLVVPIARIKELQAQIEQMRLDHLAQIAAKDAALERKDALIEAVQEEKAKLIDGLMQQAIPAIVRAGVVMDKLHTDTTGRPE